MTEHSFIALNALDGTRSFVGKLAFGEKYFEKPTPSAAALIGDLNKAIFWKFNKGKNGVFSKPKPEDLIVYQPMAEDFIVSQAMSQEIAKSLTARIQRHLGVWVMIEKVGKDYQLQFRGAEVLTKLAQQGLRYPCADIYAGQNNGRHLS
jgi:hypothetical protein